MLDRYRDCDSEWELLSENGFVDIFLLVLSYAFTQKMVGIGINEILKGSFIKQAKFCVNLAFLSAIYGYTAIMFVAIVSSFVYIFGKMVKNRLVLMLVLANALICIFTYPDVVSIVVEHGKHVQEAFENSKLKLVFDSKFSKLKKFYTEITQIAIILSLFRSVSFSFEDTTQSLDNYFDFLDFMNGL